MKRVIIIISLIAIFIHVKAIDPKALLNEANALYSKAQFDKAIEKYKEIVKAGYASSELYYNLGNSYFKTHEIKSAILYFEKAKLLDPSDKDIDFNLELARGSIVDKINAVPEVFFVTWMKWLRNQMSANGWAVFSIAAFLFSLMLFLLYLLSGKLYLKKTGFWMGVTMLFLAITSFVMGYQLKWAQQAKNSAIIFTPSVTLKSSPSESGNNLFILHEGTKVEILDDAGDWREIRIADGNRGWIKISDIETI
jgi:tetratricopeptide (TPR) repeat protein